MYPFDNTPHLNEIIKEHNMSQRELARLTNLQPQHDKLPLLRQGG